LNDRPAGKLGLIVKLIAGNPGFNTVGVLESMDTLAKYTAGFVEYTMEEGICVADTDKTNGNESNAKEDLHEMV